MKSWILLAIAVMLLFWMVSREQFEPTASIKAPPYDDAEKKRMFNMVHERSPSPPYSQLGYQTRLIDQVKRTNPQLRNDQNALEIKAGTIVSQFVQQFYNDIYRPATTPITNEQVDSYVETHPAGQNKDVQRDILKTYFVDQSGVGTSQEGSGETEYANALAALGQDAGYLHTGDNEAGSSAAEVAAEVAAGAAAGSSTASSGGRGGSSAGRGGSSAGRGGSSAGRGGSSAGRGGSSAGRGGSSAGRNGGAAGGVTPASGTRVFGPEFKGFGKDGGDGNGGRSSRQYPELWGGTSGAAAGDQSSVMLPPTSSLGLDANAIFFPYSRSPGDMDQIPDPYRVSQAWLPSRYSYNKTEPAPFLTDFSAFLK